MVLLDISGHVLVVRLVGAAANLQQLGVPPEALHLVLTHIAVASQHLDGAVRDALGHGRAVELHTVSVQAVAVGLCEWVRRGCVGGGSKVDAEMRKMV